MDYIWDLSYCGGDLCSSALETEKCSVFTPAVVRGDPDDGFFFVCFFFKDWSQGDRIVIVQIYIHNFHNHIHHHRCCSADMEKERTSNPGVSPSLKKNKKNKKRFLKYSDVSNVSLFCSLFE